MCLNGSGQSWSTAPGIRMWDSFNSKGWFVGSANNIDAGDFYIRTLPGEDTNPGSSQQEFTIKHASGNVGIGTTSPQLKLHVSGSTGAGSGIRQSRAGVRIWDQQIDSSGRLIWSHYTSEGGTANQLLTLDDSNNVGIGTTSPTSRLHIYESINQNK